MLPNPKREETNSPERCDSIAEIFGLPTGQCRAAPDSSPAQPQRPSWLHAALSRLCWFILDGFAVCGSTMHPWCEDPCDPFASLHPRHREDAEQSPWDFDDVAEP
jgi:hypothetical protein